MLLTAALWVTADAATCVLACWCQCNYGWRLWLATAILHVGVCTLCTVADQYGNMQEGKLGMFMAAHRCTPQRVGLCSVWQSTTWRLGKCACGQKGHDTSWGNPNSSLVSSLKAPRSHQPLLGRMAMDLDHTAMALKALRHTQLSSPAPAPATLCHK